MMEPVFGKFYKYRTLGEEGSVFRERLREIIVDRAIYFAKPTELNDPFDCRPIVDVSEPMRVKRTARKMTNDVLNQQEIQTSRKVRKQLDQKVFERLHNQTQRSEDLYSTLDANIGVFCMSGIPNSRLQWAYYGDSHRGVCLEFKIPEDSGWYTVPVTYSEKRPTINVVSMVDDSDYRTQEMLKAVTTKSADWKHECEFRALQDHSGKIDFPPGYLVGIIFGLGASQEDMDYVYDLVESSEIEPTFQRAEMGSTDFEIVIVEHAF